MVVVSAKVLDSTHLELLRPIAARQGGTVLVSVAEPDEKEADDRAQWLALSAASLQAAYTDTEPDYPVSMIRESNPEYLA